MALTFRNIKKWFLMLTGRSVLHVKQTLGAFFVPDELRGYFNSMEEKVAKQNHCLGKGIMPSYVNSKGKEYVFPVAVIQYGLGCYDLYLRTGNPLYKQKFIECSDWIIQKQNENGSIPNFIDDHPDKPFGAMCQGEAASLLTRAFKETQEPIYIENAKKALQFMLLDVEKGGTTIYDDNRAYLLEFTFRKPVLNGWIFAFFGVYDYLLIDRCSEFEKKYDLLLSSIIDTLPLFDCKYWSMYDLAGRITSPFYHNLHIAQLEALFLVSGNKTIENYLKKWKSYKKNPFRKMRAFLRKAFQKIRE